MTTAEVTLRLSDVTVNGEPLDVGDDCRADGPLTTPDSPVEPDNLVLTGGNQPGDPTPQYAAILYGGALAGPATIPPFRGCGANGEDLDPLLTATVSGPANDIKVVQGPLCPGGVAEIACAGGPQDTNPSTAPIWEVTHGGDFAGDSTGPVTLGSFAPLRITCAQSGVSGTIADRPPRPLRGGLGSLTVTMGGCTGTDGSTWTITQQSPGSLDPVLYDFGTGTNYARLGQLALTLRGSGPGTGVPPGGQPCTATLGGTLGFSYSAPPDHTLTFARNINRVTTGGALLVDSTCADVRSGGAVALTGTYPLSRGTAIITSPSP